MAHWVNTEEPSQILTHTHTEWGPLSLICPSRRCWQQVPASLCCLKLWVKRRSVQLHGGHFGSHSYSATAELECWVNDKPLEEGGVCVCVWGCSPRHARGPCSPWEHCSDVCCEYQTCFFFSFFPTPMLTIQSHHRAGENIIAHFPAIHIVILFLIIMRVTCVSIPTNCSIL